MSKEKEIITHFMRTYIRENAQFQKVLDDIFTYLFKLIKRFFYSTY